MSRPIATSLFIFSPLAARSSELYQVLQQGIERYQHLGHRLTQLAEQAHAVRQHARLKELAQLLVNHPNGAYQSVGHYYLAIATHRRAEGDTSEAIRLLELAIDTAPDAYKAKAMLSLGSLSVRRRDFDSALYYYRETLKSGKLSATGLHTIKAISVIKAMEGSHAQAVKDLESILPLGKYVPAHIYFDLLNSYAVELGEVGRKDEARNIIRAVLASPLAPAYPEWRETAEALRPPRPSFVGLVSPRSNVLALPRREPDPQPTLQPQPARVLDLAKWKKKMARRAREKQTEQLLEEMSVHDIALKLLEIITENLADEVQMRTILAFVMNLLSEPAQPPDMPTA